MRVSICYGECAEAVFVCKITMTVILTLSVFLSNQEWQSDIKILKMGLQDHHVFSCLHVSSISSAIPHHQKHLNLFVRG